MLYFHDSLMSRKLKLYGKVIKYGSSSTWSSSQTRALQVRLTRPMHVYKQVHTKKKETRVIALQIPVGARVNWPGWGTKLRCDVAKVIQMPKGVRTLYSKRNDTFIYRLGRTVRPHRGFTPSHYAQCAGGIHFYLTKAEARDN